VSNAPESEPLPPGLYDHLLSRALEEKVSSLSDPRLAELAEVDSQHSITCWPAVLHVVLLDMLQVGDDLLIDGALIRWSVIGCPAAIELPLGDEAVALGFALGRAVLGEIDISSTQSDDRLSGWLV
jgi:hypothetical protein